MLAHPLAILLLSSLAASVSAAHIRDRNHVHHARAATVSTPVVEVEAPSNGTVRRRNLPRRCINKTTSTSISSTQTTQQASSTSSSAPPATTTQATPDPSTGGGGSGGAGKPANWPTVTQAGPIPSIRAANSADPHLKSLSYALNNKNNDLYTQTYNGDITYYGQGLGACGDTYDDSSYTAAVSQLLYDTWPGANGEQNRNPICGPYAPGRNVLSQIGTFVSAVPSTIGGINIGGDGLPNCITGKQCHIPLTATVTNPATGKSIVVKIVDRCVGCKKGDIDMTPTAFAAIADMDSGRVSGCHWKFNQY